MPRLCASAISASSSAFVPRCGSICVKSVIQYPWYPAEASAPVPWTARFLNDGVSQMAVVPSPWM